MTLIWYICNTIFTLFSFISHLTNSVFEGEFFLSQQRWTVRSLASDGPLPNRTQKCKRSKTKSLCCFFVESSTSLYKFVPRPCTKSTRCDSRLYFSQVECARQEHRKRCTTLLLRLLTLFHHELTFLNMHVFAINRKICCRSFRFNGAWHRINNRTTGLFLTRQ